VILAQRIVGLAGRAQIFAARGGMGAAQALARVVAGSAGWRSRA
jgi:urocanate hydratase